MRPALWTRPDTPHRCCGNGVPLRPRRARNSAAVGCRGNQAAPPKGGASNERGLQWGGVSRAWTARTPDALWPLRGGGLGQRRPRLRQCGIVQIPRVPSTPPGLPCTSIAASHPTTPPAVASFQATCLFIPSFIHSFVHSWSPVSAGLVFFFLLGFMLIPH